ncbi:hypothetical protein [Aurantimonas coralicida]|uniref:hypothetical protein n=1 Tax=Aurantimonas coralicida TaxID=182270 RepID=UPI001E32B3B0|nr:hypothetical protein [Aurantimonas coralicida]MCD1644142.1 hypothetical protein [Aurantimonas coralicida]
MGEVRSLGPARAARNRDNRLYTPVECLEGAAEDLRTGDFPCNKLMVLVLDDDDGAYASRFYACNLKASEQLALLEAMKARVLKNMGYID